MSQCGSGYYADNLLVCQECDAPTSHCETCKTTSSNCLSCVAGFYLNGNVCGVDCPANYFKDESARKCILCSSNCLECSLTAANCTACDPAKNLFLENNVCVANCLQSNYFKNAASQKCEKCSDTCLACVGNQLNCTSCAQALYYQTVLAGTEHRCVSDCGAELINPLTKHCQTTCLGTFCAAPPLAPRSVRPPRPALCGRQALPRSFCFRLAKRAEPLTSKHSPLRQLQRLRR